MSHIESIIHCYVRQTRRFKGCLLDLKINVDDKKTVDVNKLADFLGTDVEKIKKFIAYGNGKNEQIQ